ncbi:MAG: 30S ribosomal protein S21 [Planctomycetota bacterium]|nr:MAG: 30S ribosomal protein S21 [Planctomycetota bacterium]
MGTGLWLRRYGGPPSIAPGRLRPESPEAPEWNGIASQLAGSARHRRDRIPGPTANEGSSLIKVPVRQNESLEAAIRRFKRQCNYAGIFKIAKAKTWYEKPTTANRREKRERMRTIQKAERMRRQSRF